MANKLVDTLERFNRKERNLLIRAALGHQASPLHLAAGFRRQVACELGFRDIIPADAWWATDYHMSWLAGALAVYAEGDEVLKKCWANDPSPNGRRLVEGNQEDVDLVIAFDNQILLIEAKAYGTFSNEQMRSKLARLELLNKFYEKIKSKMEPSILFHLLLISPQEPQKLECDWPTWNYRVPDTPWVRRGAKVPWIKLQLDLDVSVLKVTRCDPDGKPRASGNCWQVIKN